MLCYKMTSNKSQILINIEHDLQFDIANVKSTIQI